MEDITVYSRENPMPQERFSELFEIMEYSFPPTERGSRRLHYREFEREGFRSLCLARDGLRGGKIAAFMNYYDFGDFIFLEHFAVAQELRDMGMGSQLMHELMRREGRPIVLEAEPAAQSGEAERRTEFYKRLGFCVNPFTYYQPAFSAEYPSIELALLSYPDPLPEEEFLRIRDILYDEVYEIDPPNDAPEF